MGGGVRELQTGERTELQSCCKLVVCLTRFLASHNTINCKLSDKFTQ